MPLDYSFLENVAPKQEQEPVVQTSGMANVAIRVDADCMMQCDGEYVDLPLKAGMMAKTQLPTGQHLLEFLSEENPNIKVEKMVDWPEADKNYLVIVNELKAAIAQPMPQASQQATPPRNPFLDQLQQMAQMNPLAGMSAPPMPGAMPGMPPSTDNNQ